MFKSIVLGLDGSQHSLHALESARILAEHFGAKLILVHAYPRTSDLRRFEGYDRLVSQRKNAGQAILDDARKRLDSFSCEIEEDLLEGPAAEAILSVAETRPPDLIVLGTRGMGSVKGLVMGSVSHKVTHHAPCTVMVVR